MLGGNDIDEDIFQVNYSMTGPCKTTRLTCFTQDGERQIMHGPSLTEAGLPSQEPEFMPEVRDAKHRPLPLALPFAPVGFNLADWPPAKTK